MRARDIMTENVVTVSPETAIAEAAGILLRHRISGVPVVDGSGKLVGILSEGDLMRRAELGSGRRTWWQAPDQTPEQNAKAYVKAHGLTVKDVMTTDVVTLDEHDTLDRIALIFEQKGIKRAPVLRGGEIAGIVSRANLLRGLAAGRTGSTGPSDSEIRSVILRTAAADAAVRTMLVDATVANGIVHLWGNVASEDEREAIRVVAEGTDGAREVHNHIRVLPASDVDYKPE